MLLVVGNVGEAARVLAVLAVSSVLFELLAHPVGWLGLTSLHAWRQDRQSECIAEWQCGREMRDSALQLLLLVHNRTRCLDIDATIRASVNGLVRASH